MVKKGLKIAKVVARTESRRLAKWVYNSPTSLRALSFLCGASLFFASLFSFVFDLFSGAFSAFMVSFWLIIFSMLIILVEGRVKAFEAYVASERTRQTKRRAVRTK